MEYKIVGYGLELLKERAPESQKTDKMSKNAAVKMTAAAFSAVNL